MFLSTTILLYCTIFKWDQLNFTSWYPFLNKIKCTWTAPHYIQSPPSTLDVTQLNNVKSDSEREYVSFTPLNGRRRPDMMCWQLHYSIGDDIKDALTNMAKINLPYRKWHSPKYCVNIGLGKKECRICDRNLTLYLTYLELSNLSQICAVLFANLLPFRRQRHYPPLIEPPSLFEINSDSQFSQVSLRPT